MSNDVLRIKTRRDTYENPYNLQVIRRIIREGYGKVPDSPIVTPPAEKVRNEFHTLKRDCMYIYGIRGKPRRKKEVPEATPEISYLVQEYTGPIQHMPWAFPPIDELEIPMIKSIGIKESIVEMSEYFGCTDYEYNLLHFWFLDIVTDCIWESQDTFDFNDAVQKHILRWVLFFMDIIRDPKDYSRNEFLYILQESVNVIYGLIRTGDYQLYNPVQIIEVPEHECDFEATEDGEKVVGESASTDSVINILTDIHLKDLSRPPFLQNIKIKRKSAIETLTEEQKKKCRLECRDYEIVTRAVNTSRLYSRHDSTVINTPNFFLNLPSPKTYRTEDETLYTVEEEDLTSEYVMDQLNLTNPPILKADLPDRDVQDTSVDNIPSQVMIHSEDEVLLAPRFDMKVVIREKSTGHVLFQNDNAVSDSTVASESTCSKTIDDDISNIRLPTPQIPVIDSDRTRAKKIIDALNAYKLKEERMNHLDDSELGLSPSEYSEVLSRPPLMMSIPSKSVVSYEPSTNTCDFTERSEMERLARGIQFNLDTEKGINACREKQFFSMGILWMISDYVYNNLCDCFQFILIKLALQLEQNTITQDLNDDWKTPKLLTEDITKFLKDIKDKYKQVIIRAKQEKPKKEKKGKKDKKSKKGDKSSKKSDKKSKKKSDKKSKKSDKQSKKSDMKSKSSKKKGLTESEIRLKIQQEADEAERIRQQIHAHFLFPLQDAVTDELFQKMFDPWQRTVDWRTGKKIIDPNAKPSKKAKKKK